MAARFTRDPGTMHGWLISGVSAKSIRVIDFYFSMLEMELARGRTASRNFAAGCFRRSIGLTDPSSTSSRTCRQSWSSLARCSSMATSPRGTSSNSSVPAWGSDSIGPPICEGGCCAPSRSRCHSRALSWAIHRPFPRCIPIQQTRREVPDTEEGLTSKGSRRGIGRLAWLARMRCPARATELGRGGAVRLADRVRHVSVLDGDGLGFDILSFAPDGSERYLEVKTTRYSPHQPFFVSRNEVEFSGEESERFSLIRVYRFGTTRPGWYELPGALRSTSTLRAESFVGLPISPGAETFRVGGPPSGRALSGDGDRECRHSANGQRVSAAA